jgi:hypothetical protein
MERRPKNKYLNLATAKERSCLDQPFLKVERFILYKKIDINIILYNYIIIR